MSEITVVVPVYKVEKYLNRCVDSILNQTFRDFELILVDDGSPDNCPKICDSYSKKDNRVRVIHKENGGLSDARNVGIDYMFKHSNSKWITFIDSDDWVHEKYLEILYNAVIDNKLNVSVCGFVRIENEEQFINLNDYKVELIEPEELYVSNNVNFIVAWGKLYHKSCFNEIRYPYGKIHEDEFTTWKMLFKEKTVAFFNAPLYNYYTNPSGIMNSEWTPKRLEAFEAFKEQMHFFKSNGYVKAYSKIMLSCLYFLYEQNQIINQIQYKKFVRKNIKKLLMICRKENLFNFWKTVFAYEIAYPRTMFFLWHVPAFQSAFKKYKESENDE